MTGIPAAKAMWNKPALMNLLADALFAAAVMMVLGVVALRVAQLPAFELREVRIDGTLRHVTRGEIEEVVRRELRGGFFTLNLAATRAAFERLPWVRNVNVRRLWPDGVEITLAEHVPFARWGRAALVNTHGEVFQAQYDGQLPVFTGPEGAAREIAIQYRYFVRSLAAIGQTPVEVQVTARRAWQVPALRERLRRADSGAAPREAGARARAADRIGSGIESMGKTRDDKNLIVGLDIGSSKIAAIVAEIRPDSGFEIIGMGSHPSRGLKKGVVVNIETTVQAIQRALEEAELMADCKIREVYTGIAGSHIRSFNSQGMVPVKDKEVAQPDIERVIDTARSLRRRTSSSACAAAGWKCAT
jgi:hypothetical protein